MTVPLKSEFFGSPPFICTAHVSSTDHFVGWRGELLVFSLSVPTLVNIGDQHNGHLSAE